MRQLETDGVGGGGRQGAGEGGTSERRFVY